MKRINLLFVAIFAGLMVWVFMFDTETTRSIQNRISTIVAPFKNTGAQVQGALTGASDDKRTPAELRAENQRLAVENGELKVFRDRAAQMQSRLNELEAILKLDRTTELRLIPAQVIVRKTGAWYRLATINRGSKHGVQDGSPVILPVVPPESREEQEARARAAREGRTVPKKEAQAALVGRVFRTNENEAEILLLTDERCKVAGRIQGENEHGLVEGVRVSTSRRPELRLRFLHRDARVVTERQVLSWDYSNRFPSGLLLGTVVEFRPGDTSSEAIVEPAVNLEDLPYVLVMQQKLEESPSPPPPAPR